MNCRHFREHPGSRRGELDKNLPSIRDSLLAADEANFFQSVHQPDGRVMFYLEPLAEISNREAAVSGEGFQGEERFVLLGRQVCFRSQDAFAEAEEFSQRVAEGSEGVVVVRVQLRSHGGYNYRTVIFLPSRKNKFLPE